MTAIYLRLLFAGLWKYCLLERWNILCTVLQIYLGDTSTRIGSSGIESKSIVFWSSVSSSFNCIRQTITAHRLSLIVYFDGMFHRYTWASCNMDNGNLDFIAFYVIISIVIKDSINDIKHELINHTCYDVLPINQKLIVFDTSLSVKKALGALLQHGFQSAPLWDSVKQKFAGMLTGPLWTLKN